MIDLRHIRHFLAVASHRTVQEAADAIHLTQPALTKSIARLEDVLDAKLFDRSGSRLTLTELGERLVLRGEDLVRRMQALEEEVDLWKGLHIGEVAIGVDAVTELGLLPQVLETFVPNHPSVQITIQSGHTNTLLPALLKGDLHFLVADAEIVSEDDDLDVHLLTPDPIAAALRPGHPLIRKKRPTRADLDAYPRLGAFTAPRFERWRIDSSKRDGYGPITPSVICDNYEVLVRLTESSDAIFFGPQTLLRSFERQQRIKIVTWPLEGPQTQPGVIRLKHRVLSPAADHLIGLFTHDSP